MPASLLIISSHLPYDGLHAQDAIEAVLAASNTGIDITFVLEYEGCHQANVNYEAIKANQTPTKSIIKQLKVLPLYDVDKLFYLPTKSVESSSTRDILPIFDEIDNDFFHDLMEKHRHILRF